MYAEMKRDLSKPRCEPRAKAVSEETEQRAAQAEGRRKENTQCTGFLNSCSPVLKSPSSCDFLPLLHRAANSVCTYTQCTLCAHTCSIRQGLCLSRKVTLEMCGGRDCVSLEDSQRQKEREGERYIYNIKWFIL